MSQNTYTWYSIIAAAALLLAGCSHAADVNVNTETVKDKTMEDTTALANAINTEDQEIKNGKIAVKQVSAESDAWIVIHADNNGKPGAILGQSKIQAGANTNVEVDINISKVTPTLYAMLHTDAGIVGTFEFPGADTPVQEEGTVVMETFKNTSVMMKAEATPSKDTKSKVNTQINVNVREIAMTAKQWEFIPSNIIVNKGDKVRLIITNTDVAHGFSLSQFNVSQRLEAGKTTTIEFTADTSGTFTYFCSVFCGLGHSDMKGTITVK